MIDDRAYTGCGAHLLDPQRLWPDALTGCRNQDGAGPCFGKYLTQ